MLQSIRTVIWPVLFPAAPQCPDPGAPANGRRVGDSFMIDDVVFFVCNDGFVIEGVILLRCLEEGVWSSPTPVCLPTSSRSRRGVWACMCAYVYVCKIGRASCRERL